MLQQQVTTAPGALGKHAGLQSGPLVASNTRFNASMQKAQDMAAHALTAVAGGTATACQWSMRSIRLLVRSLPVQNPSSLTACAPTTGRYR